MTRSRRTGALTLTLALATAACSSGSSGDAGPSGAVTPASVARASAAGGPARITGTASGTAPGRIRGGFTRANARTELVFPVAIGDATAKPQIRRVGTTSYVRRARGAPAEGLGTVVGYRGTGPTWFAMRSDRLQNLLGPADPVAALRSLGKSRLVRTGTGSVNGAAVTNYDVEPPAGSKAAGITGFTPFATGSVSDLHLAVDRNGRLVQWRLDTDPRKVEITIEYGTSVAVAPPRAEDLSVDTVETLPEPDGPWQPLAAGTANGTAWTLERAKGTRSTRCLRFTTTPAVDAANPLTKGGSCWLEPGPDDETPEYYFDLAFEATDGAVEAIAAMIPPGTADSAEVVFVGGGTAPATLDPSGAVVYVGPADRVVALVTLRHGSTIYDCGPGEVQEVADAAKVKAPGFRALRADGAWGCNERYQE